MVKVRLVRVKLPDGEVELLITSLMDIKKYPTALFKELYFKRWGIETFYDEFKNKIKVENLIKVFGNKPGSVLKRLNREIHFIIRIIPLDN